MDIYNEIFKLAERPTFRDMLECLIRADKFERSHDFLIARQELAEVTHFIEYEDNRLRLKQEGRWPK